tara:strand:- start:134 stop:328 length:195 start_codon:yes stop_codon:yes gene_type:complete
MTEDPSQMVASRRPLALQARDVTGPSVLRNVREALRDDISLDFPMAMLFWKTGRVLMFHKQTPN